MSEENKELTYLGADDLLTVKAFTTTRKVGYVEEEVDEWVKEARSSQEKLVNEYNTLVYRCLLAENEVKELTEKLATQQEAAPANSPVVTETVTEEVVEETPTEAFTYTDTPSYEEPETEVEDNYNYVTPVAEATTQVAAPSARAQQILESAAAEAAEHVTRALEKVTAVEAEAEAEAAQMKYAAEMEATQLVTDAEAEATTIKETAVTEAEEAVARKLEAESSINNLFTRIKTFHQFELEKVEEILGTNVSEETSVEEKNVSESYEGDQTINNTYDYGVDDYETETITEETTTDAEIPNVDEVNNETENEDEVDLNTDYTTDDVDFIPTTPVYTEEKEEDTYETPDSYELEEEEEV